MKRLNATGSHVVAVAVVILALGVVGYAGYTVMQRSNTHASDTAAAKTEFAAPASIDSKADLETTATSLDKASGQIDSSVDATSLDSSMNDLL
jgi:hypothetical protein